MSIERFDVDHQRYLGHPDPNGDLCYYKDVEQLEAQHAAVCAHMMRMFYALVSFTNPQPDDDATEVMAEAKQALELYLNDSSMVVTVELPDDESEVTP